VPEQVIDDGLDQRLGDVGWIREIEGFDPARSLKAHRFAGEDDD
jgi:hypothetical protein